MNTQKIAKRRATTWALIAMAICLSAMPIHASAGAPTFADNLAVAEQYFAEVWSQGNVEQAQFLVAPDFQRLDRSQPTQVLGRAGTLFLANYLHAGFSDVTFAIDAAVTEGDVVAVCWTARGTHDGGYSFLPATNRPMEWTGMSFLTIHDGKVVQEMTNLENVSNLLGSTEELRFSPSYAQ